MTGYYSIPYTDAACFARVSVGDGKKHGLTRETGYATQTMAISKLELHVKADIIYRLKNDIMEDCFLFFCCSDQQILSSALTQQFNYLTRLFY